MGAQGVQIEDAADFANLHEGKYRDHGLNLLIHHQFRAEKWRSSIWIFPPKRICS